MRHIGNTLFILAAASTIAAIWTPLHWQFAATAVLLFLAGAYAHGTHLTAQAPGMEATPAEDKPAPTKARPHNNYGTPA